MRGPQPGPRARGGWRLAAGAASARLGLLCAALLGSSRLAVHAEEGAQRREYWTEQRGQDTYVHRSSDDAVVYSTSVADTSEGTDTDSDIRGDEEFFHGCLWTFRQQLGMCQGGSCADAEILAHDLQRRLLSFYSNRQSPAAPPLEAAAWLTLGTRPEQRRELAESCPGLMVTVLLFMAEVLAFTGEGEGYAREAELYAATLQQSDPVQFETMLDMFPVREAYEGNSLARSMLQARGSVIAEDPAKQPTVDIVVSRCSSSLQWLWELDFPARTRVLVYDKCKHDPEDFKAQTEGLTGVASVEHRPMEETGPSGFMTGECTAYLTHIVQSLRSNTLADFTIFVHDDAPRHIRLSLLSLVLRGIRSTAYEVPFLHLSHERYPAFRTPCLKDVYRKAMGAELTGRLSTYCCAHFAVGRARIEARGAEFFARLLRLVSEARYSREQGGGCNIGKKPCYVMEFLWHHVFGEGEELPPRAEDPGLPLALRYEGGRESQLPSPLKVAPYMAMFQPSRYSRLLERSR